MLNAHEPVTDHERTPSTRHERRVAHLRRTRRLRLLAGGATVVALVGLAGVAVASAPDQRTPSPSAAGVTGSTASTPDGRTGQAASRGLGGGRVALVPTSTTAATAATPLPAGRPVRLVATSWKQNAVTTAPATVGDLLAASGVTPDKDDTLTVGPARTGDIAAGAVATVTVHRVTVAKKTTRTRVEHATRTVTDSSRYAALGTTVRTAGKDGTKTVVQRVTTVDGTVTARKVLSSHSTAVTEVLVRGTKKSPAKASPAQAQAIARSMAAKRGWGAGQFECLVSLWNRESGWRVDAANPSSGAYGIPQSLPGSKMATVGADWRTNATTQIAWGLDYIARSYGSPCGAWAHSQATNWY